MLSRTLGRVTLPDAVSWVQGDLTDPASLKAALRDVRVVVHTAALLPGGQIPNAEFERVNAGGTESLARAARDMGIQQFIHIGSAGVYGDGRTASPHQESGITAPSTPYEKSKLSSEQALTAALEGSRIHWTILRPQGLYGPDRPATAAFFRMVAQKKLWLHGPAHVVVHPTHIADLAAAVGLVLDRNDLQREVINIGGARALEYHELISLTGARVGHVPFQLCAPPWISQIAALTSRALAAVGKPPALLARLSHTWVNRGVSIEKARRLLGFEPLSLESGLDQTAAELSRRGLI